LGLFSHFAAFGLLGAPLRTALWVGGGVRFNLHNELVGRGPVSVLEEEVVLEAGDDSAP